MLSLHRESRCAISQEQTVQNFLQLVLKSVSGQAVAPSAPTPLHPSLLGKVGGGVGEVGAPRNGW